MSRHQLRTNLTCVALQATLIDKPAEFADKLERMLTALHFARTIDEIDLVPGWKLHPLKGDLKGYWSLTVTRNHRLIFRFAGGDAHDLDLVDYH